MAILSNNGLNNDITAYLELLQQPSESTMAYTTLSAANFGRRRHDWYEDASSEILLAEVHIELVHGLYLLRES